VLDGYAAREPGPLEEGTLDPATVSRAHELSEGHRLS
jgi:hypothetical protein